MPKHAEGRRAICLTMDCDAIALLRYLSPSGKAYGHVLGELVRAEVLRREMRKQPGYLDELFSDEAAAAVASHG